jgi:hypothetical protein
VAQQQLPGTAFDSNIHECVLDATLSETAMYEKVCKLVYRYTV